MSLSTNRYRDLEKLIAPIRDKYKVFLKARIDNNPSGDKIAAAHTALLEALDKDRQTLTANPLVKDYFEHIEQKAKIYADAPEQEKKFAGVAAIKPLREPFQRELYWIITTLDREDHNGMRKYFDQGMKVFETKRADIEKLPEGADFIAYLTGNFFVFLEDFIKDTAGHVEAVDKTDQANSQMRTAEDAAKRGDTANATRYWEELGKKVAPIISTTSWHWYYEVKDFLDRYTTLSAKFSDSVGDAKAKQEIEDIGRQVKIACTMLNRALDSKNPSDCTKYSAEVEKYLEPLVTKFADKDPAKPFITEANALLQRYRVELEPLLKEADAKALIEELKGPLTWLQTSLNQKREGDVPQYRDKLEPKLSELKEKYASVEVAAKFIQQADEVLARVDNELGAMIADKQVKAITEKLEPQLTWLNRYLIDKNVTQVKSAVTAVETMTAQLKRYESHPNAKDTLTNATALLKRVETELGAIIAAEEIQKSITALHTPLTSLESSIRRKDIPSILTYQDRVSSLANPLRKYAGNQQADAVLTRVDGLLQRIDTEIAQIIAEQSVKKISGQVQSLVASTAAMTDANAAAQNISKLLYLVHPMRVQYGHFDAVKQLVQPVDELVLKFKPQLNQVQQQEAQRIKPEIEKSLHEIESSTSPAVTAQLKNLNKRAFALKKTMLIDDSVNSLIVKLDQLNLKLIGCVPVDEEYLPIFEVNPNSTSEVQSVLTKMNENNAQFNKKLIEVKQKFDSLDRMGVGCSLYNASTRTFTDPYETRGFLLETSKKLVDKLESPLLEDLMKADPMASEIQVVKESIETTRNLVGEMQTNYAKLCQYIRANALAYWLLRGASQFVPHIQEFTANSKINSTWQFNYQEVPDDVRRHLGYTSLNVPCNTAYIVVVQLIDAAVKAAKEAQEALPENSVEAADCLTAAEELKKIALERHAQLCQKYIEHHMKGSQDDYDWKERTKIWIDSAKELLPDHPVIVQLDQQYNAKLDEIKNAAALRAAEAQKKREEEQAQKRAMAEALQNELSQYTAGTVTCGGVKWSYSQGTLKCETGTLNGWSATFKADPLAGDMVLAFNESNKTLPELNYHWDGKTLRGGFTSITIEFSERWHLVLKTSTLDTHGAQVTGAVPPPLVTVAATMPETLRSMKRDLEDDIDDAKIAQWKQIKYSTIAKRANKSCPRCSVSGHNFRYCSDCENIYCTTSGKCWNTSNGQNVCPACGSYSGDLVPSSADWIKDPRDNEHSAVAVNLPQWALKLRQM